MQHRNTAHCTEHDDYGDDADLAKPVRPLEFEDVGGQAVDDDEPRSDDEDNKDRTQGLQMTKTFDSEWIQQLLTREKEIRRANQPGKRSDECKVMKKMSVKKVFLSKRTHLQRWRYRSGALRLSGDSAKV